jgi:hypothetical protein
MNQFMKVRLERTAENKFQEKSFAKDKSKSMVTMKSSTVFNIEENKPSAKLEAIFDDQFEFVHRRIRFGISCFYKKDALEKLVKLYQFQKLFLTKIIEIPAIKRETVDLEMQPSEYPACAILNEAINNLNLVNPNIEDNIYTSSFPNPCNKYVEVPGKAESLFGALENDSVLLDINPAINSSQGMSAPEEIWLIAREAVASNLPRTACQVSFS